MLESPTPVDPLSEMLALSTYANTKNLIVTAVELRGSFDADAFKIAFRTAVDKFPQFRSTLKEIKTRGRYHLVRELRPDLENRFRVWDLSDADSSGSNPEDFLIPLAEVLDRNWDLFTELPVECHVAKLAPDLHVAAPVVHHCASDGATASELGKELLIAYHQLLTGENSRSGCYAQAITTAAKRTVRARKMTWRDSIAEHWQALTPMIAKSTLPAGSGNPTSPAQYHIMRTFSRERSERIMAGSLKRGTPFVDALVACADMAVDKWNEERDIPAGIITTSMTVNMKGRFRGIDAPNTSSILYFKSTPEERADPASFAKAVSISRIKQFRKQLDRRYYENVVAMTNTLRILPFNMRRRIVYRIAQKHQLSVAITLLGAIWPKEKDGRPSTDSCLTHVGGADVAGIYGIGYKLLSSTHLLFIVYVFDGKLNFLLGASACHFTRDEAEAFLDLFLEILLEITDAAKAG